MDRKKCIIHPYNIKIIIPEEIYVKLNNYFTLMINEEENDNAIEVVKFKNSYTISYKEYSVYNQTIEQVYGYLLEEIEKQLINDSLNIVLHCSSVILEGKVTIFIGSRHSGKSTALLNLLSIGYDYFSDDFVYLKDSKVKKVIFPIKSRTPQNNSLKVEISEETKYLLNLKSKQSNVNKYYEIDKIFFPKYGLDSNMKITKLEGVEIFNKLLENCKKTVSIKKAYFELRKLVNIPTYAIEYNNTETFYKCFEFIKQKEHQ